jgi:hypothetical protein
VSTPDKIFRVANDKKTAIFEPQIRAIYFSGAAKLDAAKKQRYSIELLPNL